MESPLMTKAEEILKRTIQRCRELNIIIPTYRQMRDPDEIPAEILAEVKGVGIDEVNPRNYSGLPGRMTPGRKMAGLER
jgi:hypothetical protein